MSLLAKIEVTFLICSSTMKEHFWRFMKFCSHIELLQTLELVLAPRWSRKVATEFMEKTPFALSNQEEVSFITIETEWDKSLKQITKSWNSCHHIEVNLIQMIPMFNTLYQASWVLTNQCIVLPNKAILNKKWLARLSQMENSWEEVNSMRSIKALFKEWLMSTLKDFNQVI